MARNQVIVSITSNIKPLQKGLNQATSGLNDFAKKAVATGAVLAVMFKGFERLKAIDTARAKLTAFGYSAVQVADAMKSVERSVIGTQFAMGEMSTVATSALAAGVKLGTGLTKYLGLIADAAAATGGDLAGMALVFNQITAAGRLYTQDANQLVARGIPVWKLLADQYGVTATAMRKMVEQGKVDAKTFFEVMDDYIGGTAKNVDSFEAAVSNLNASLGRIGAGLLGGDLDESKETVKGLTEALKSLEPAALAVGQSFQTLLGAFNDTPGPVKAATVALAAFLLVARTKGFQSFATGVIGATAALRSLGTTAATTRVFVAGLDGSITQTTGRMAAMSASASLLGATARKAGTALLGAFGGPVGLAITGVSLALGALIGLWMDGQAAAAEQKAAIDELTTTLDENTGALTTNSRAWIVSHNKERLQAVKDMGISVKDYTDALMGNADAEARVRAELEKRIAAGTAWSARGGRVMTQDARNASAAFQDLDTQLLLNEEAAKSAALEAEALGDSTKEMGDQALAAAGDLSTLRTKLDAVLAPMKRAADQQSSFYDLADSIRENGSAMDTLSREGIANLGALESTVQAMVANSGGDFASLAGNMQALAQVLIDNGFNSAEVMAYLGDVLHAVTGGEYKLYLNASQFLAESSVAIQAANAVISAATAAQSMVGPAVGNALAQKGAIQTSVANYKSTFSGLTSTFKGLGRAAGSAGRAMGGAGKSAKQTAKELKALRAEIYATAKAWLKPSTYSSGAQSVMDSINDAYKSGAISKKKRDQLLASVKKTDKKMQQIEKQREALAEKIQAANDKLQEAIQARADFRLSIIEGIRGLGDLSRFMEQTERTITEVFQRGDRTFTVQRTESVLNDAKSIVDGLKNQVEQAKKFKAAFDQLKAQGLNETSLRNLLDEFMSSGDASLAESMKAGGQAAIDEVNNLMKQLGDITGTESAGWAKDLAASWYDAGVESAKGILKGLESQDSKLKKAYEKLADDLVKTVKKKLGIKSPSTIFADVALQTIKGFVKGVDQNTVLATRSMERLSDSVVSGFAPELEPVKAAPAVVARGGNHYTINIESVAPSAEVGRVVLQAIRTYENEGGGRL